MAKQELIEEDGEVLEVLPDGRFSLQLDNGHKMVAYLSGRLKKFKIKIIAGDKVRVELSPYDLNNGRITYRYK